METTHKTFKPFDKVLVRTELYPKWSADYYSHYDYKINRHETIGGVVKKDDDILPYEGFEHLVGTTDEPLVTSSYKITEQIPLFTLTPEEADIALKSFMVAKACGQIMYDDDIKKGHANGALLSLSIIRNANKFIERIKRWQDENRE